MSPTYRPTLEEFLQAAREHFSYLTAEFRLPEQSFTERGSANRFQVRYANDAVLVIVEGCDHGFSADIEIGRFINPLGSIERALPLWPILKLRRPDFLETCRKADGQLAQLREYSAALRECAADVLTGDLSILPAASEVLQLWAAQERAKEKQRDYKSASIRASTAFFNEDYLSFLRLLEPFVEWLTPTQQREMDYALRRLSR